MAKKALLIQNEKRKLLFDKYEPKRKEIRKQIKELRLSKSFDKILPLQRKLDSLPRNSSCSRLRNRCMLTGRCRGLVCYKLFGMCSFQLRQHINNGFIVGVYKR